MAKRTPFPSQAERLERLIKNLQDEVAGIKTVVDVDRSIVTAEILKVTGVEPQIIRVSEGGGLEAGGEPLPWRGAITEEASHTGDTSETEVGKITVPGDKMGVHGYVSLFVFFRAERTGGGTGNHTFRVYFDGQILANHTGNFANLMVDMTPRFIWNQGVTNLQSSGFRLTDRHTRAGEAPYPGVADTTADVDITFTVQNAVAAHTAYLRSAFVEAIFSN